MLSLLVFASAADLDVDQRHRHGDRTFLLRSSHCTKQINFAVASSDLREELEAMDASLTDSIHRFGSDKLLIAKIPGYTFIISILIQLLLKFIDQVWRHRHVPCFFWPKNGRLWFSLPPTVKMDLNHL